MSSFDRRHALALIAGLAVAGCRFEPAMRKGSPAASLPGQFSYSVPGGRNAFLLEESLRTQLGPPTGVPDYSIDVALTISEGKAAATGSGGVDRLALTGTADFTVSAAADGAALTEGTVQGVVTFSSTDEVIASDAARQDAERRLVNLLAERIATRLILTSPDWVL